MTGGRPFKKRQILRQPPREGVVDSDTIVAFCGNNEGERRGHNRLMIVEAGALHSDRCFDRGMRLVADDFDIFVLVIKNCGWFALQQQLGQGQGLA